MADERVIFHLDMDSYFASAEQQARPYLRGKPVAVSGKEGSRSVIVASSREAKKFGVKTAMLHHEARRLCPGLIFVEGDGTKYEYLTKRLIEILEGYTEKVEVFSIDEAFLDMTGYCQTVEQIIYSARQIKLEIKSKLGEWVTASIGIANNKILAKLASDMNKPDGLFFINEQNLPSVLDRAKLTDFCGIGRGLNARLSALGIDSVVKLREQPLLELIKLFGQCAGRKLYEIVRGIDDSPVLASANFVEVKSVGRSYTLPKNTFNKEEILSVLFHLCEKIGRELRRKDLAGKTVIIYLRYADFTHGGFRKTVSGFINDGLAIFKMGKERLDEYKLPKAVRLVGVHVSNLTRDYRQLPLWISDRKRASLLPALDKINDTFGELTIKPAYLLKLKRLKNKVGGFRLRD